MGKYVKKVKKCNDKLVSINLLYSTSFQTKSWHKYRSNKRVCPCIWRMCDPFSWGHHCLWISWYLPFVRSLSSCLRCTMTSACSEMAAAFQQNEQVIRFKNRFNKSHCLKLYSAFCAEFIHQHRSVDAIECFATINKRDVPTFSILFSPSTL